MHRMKLYVAAAVCALMTACGGKDKPAEEPEGPMEKAGEAVDDTASDVEDAAEKTVEDVGEAAGDTGDAVREGTKDED